MSAVAMVLAAAYRDEYDEGHEYGKKQQRPVREICFLKLKSLSNVIPRLRKASDGVML